MFIARTLATVILSVAASLGRCDILVTGLSDITGNAMPGSARDLVITEHLCVGVTGGGNYSFEAHGDGSSGRFEISNSTHTLNYRLYYRDRSSGFIELQPNVYTSSISGKALGKKDTCNGNASQLQVQIDRGQIDNAPAGVYQGTVFVTVAPE